MTQRKKTGRPNQSGAPEKWRKRNQDKQTRQKDTHRQVSGTEEKHVQMEKLKEIELGRGSQNSGQVEGWRDENLLGGGHSHADTGKLRFSHGGQGGGGQPWRLRAALFRGVWDVARSHEGAGSSFLSTRSPALALHRPLATPAAALGKHGSSDPPGHDLRPLSPSQCCQQPRSGQPEKQHCGLTTAWRFRLPEPRCSHL